MFLKLDISVRLPTSFLCVPLIRICIDRNLYDEKLQDPTVSTSFDSIKSYVRAYFRRSANFSRSIGFGKIFWIKNGGEKCLLYRNEC